jgi:hypothetical protein
VSGLIEYAAIPDPSEVQVNVIKTRCVLLSTTIFSVLVKTQDPVAHTFPTITIKAKTAAITILFIVALR